MLVQEKNIKGFNLLELIIVLVIVGIISATAYPNFSEWRKEREVRQGLEKIKSLIKNIHVQTERGTFAFVQVLIIPVNTHVSIQSKGMTMQTLASKINDGTSNWNADTDSRCDIAAADYWDSDVAAEGSDLKNAVYSLNIEEITTNLSQTSAVCFARNGKFYEAAGDLDHSTGVLNFFYVCRRDFNADACDVDYGFADNKAFRQPPPEGEENEDYYRTVNWTRFGNVTTSKLKNEYNENGIFSGGTWIDVPTN